MQCNEQNITQTQKMADESDLVVSGKRLSSLRVVDLKQELKKKGITFKAGASKAFLQDLLKAAIESEMIAKRLAEQHDSPAQTPVQTDAEALDATQTTLMNEKTDTSVRELTLHDEESWNESDECANNSAHSGEASKAVDRTDNKIDANDSSSANVNDDNTADSQTNVDTIDRDVDNNVVSESGDKSDERPKEEVINANIERDEDSNSTLPETRETIEDRVESESESNSFAINLTVDRLADRPNDRSLTYQSDKEMDSSETIERAIESDSHSTNVNRDERQTESDLMAESRPTNDENVEPPSEAVDTIDDKQTIDEKKSEAESGALALAKVAKPARKRRWGSTNASTNAGNNEHNTYKYLSGISSDQLKELIPDLNIASATPPVAVAIVSSNSSTSSSNAITVKVSKQYDSNNSSISSNMNKPQTSSTNVEIPLKRDIRVVRKSVSVTEENSNPKTDEPLKTITVKPESKKALLVLNEEPEHKVLPSKNADSNIIFIRNLVRPFTLLQLKDVLGKTGKLVEQRFWIDKIKSKCYATYETVAEAVATRQALHGVCWPTSNPKLLIVDFATQEELDYHLNLEKPVIHEPIINNKKSDENISNEKYDILIKTERDVKVVREIENKDAPKTKVEPEVKERPIREWDREKLANNGETDRSRQTYRRRFKSPSPSPKGRTQEPTDVKRARHDSTKGGERIRVSAERNLPTAPPPEPESPAKLLDDLFKKTNTTPSIYWLPLTEEQIVVRDAHRLEMQKEREARDELNRKRQEEMQIANERRERETDPTIRNDRGPNWRQNSPNRRFNSPPNRRNFMARRPSPPMRRPSPRRSPPLRHNFPPFSRSPNWRGGSPRRRR